MTSEYKRDEAREFSSEVKREEKVGANYKCRMCGKTRDVQQLECAHIYTLTKSNSWERAGTIQSNKNNDTYVKSVANCLLLCKYHHERIDSFEGLKKCTVQYLESLKTDLTHCTALIDDGKGNWRRCRNKNSRGSNSNESYRCHRHSGGGLEETLPVRTFYSPKQNKQPNQTNKDTQSSNWSCIIL